MDAADDGDVIKVASGTYTGVSAREGVTQVVYISKTVTVRGGYTTTNWTTPDPEANPTTLDAEGDGRVLYVVGNISPTIEGLHITGGDTRAWDGWQMGGGIYALSATLTLEDNWIFDNAAKQGGGVVAEHSTTTLSSNRVTSNTATGGGGGLSLWDCDATLIQNIITHNKAGSIGGAHIHRSTATLTHNTISDNTSNQDAGGLAFYDCQAMLDSNLICGNTGTRYGGGVLWTGNGSESHMVNNVIVDNQTTGQGSGLYIEGQPVYLSHNTVAWNSDGGGSGDDVGIYVEVWKSWMGYEYTTVVMTNTLLVGHGVGIQATGGNTVTVNGVLWDNSTPITVSQSPTAVVSVQNQHTGDPAFAADGYHLIPASDAIDKGVEAGLASDIDGEARPFGAGSDLGADEWATLKKAVAPTGDTVFTATVGGLDTIVAVPAEAVTEALDLQYTALAEIQGSPAGFAFASHTLDLKIYRGNTLLPGFRFEDDHPITITIYYTDTDVTGADESTLELRTWDGSAWVMDGITPVERNVAQTYARFTIAHLSRFALFGRTQSVYLPLVMKSAP